VALAVVRSIRSPRRLTTAQEIEDFEQQLVDQYALAMAANGITDRYIAHTGQLQRLLITDLCDRRLHLDGRVDILAPSVLDRIRA
jgi:hypothetical protein